MVHSRQVQIHSCRSVGLDELWLSDTIRCTGVKKRDPREPKTAFEAVHSGLTFTGVSKNDPREPEPAFQAVCWGLPCTGVSKNDPCAPRSAGRMVVRDS
jgi:hypothetical protein